MIKLVVDSNIRNAFVRNTSSITFTNSLKQPIKCITSDSSLARVCFWDRHPFNHKGIQCPISYKPKQLVKVYKSDVSKEEYTIKENVPYHKATDGSDSAMSLDSSEYEFDGKFCSYACCLAYIRANKHDPLYTHSETLLFQIFRAENNHNNKTLKVPLPAPHWRLLIDYGGPLTITDFRKSFSDRVFVYHNYISNLKNEIEPLKDSQSNVVQKNLCHLFEEQVTLI